MPVLPHNPESTRIAILDHIARIKLKNTYRSPEQEILIELIERLDDALIRGASLPLDWSNATRSRNLNGCPIEPGWARPAEPDDLYDAIEV